MNLKVSNDHCELFCDDELIFEFQKGSLAERAYNILNDKTLRIADKFGYVQPGFYRGTDAGSSRTRVWRIQDAEYLRRVRKDPTMRLLVSIFNPSATSLQLIYHAIQYTVQSQSKESLGNNMNAVDVELIYRTFQDTIQPKKFLDGNQNAVQTEEALDDNVLMYYEDINDEGEVVERHYDYGDRPNIQIRDLQSLIGYDLQFLINYKICRRCKKLYCPKKNEPYCSKTCRCELSRHRSPWCDAQLLVKKAINQEIQEMQDQLNLGEIQPAERTVLKRTLDTYNAVYNGWLTFSAGGDQSQAAKTYQLEGRQCSYTAFLQAQWEHVCRKIEMEQ